MYTTIKKTSNRLGSFEKQPRFGNFGDVSRRKSQPKPKNLGELGQGDTASGIIQALGQAIGGIVTAITQSKVLISSSRDQANVAITIAQENTKKLQISTEGQVQLAHEAIGQTKESYSGITKVILGSGAVLAIVLISAAYSYGVVSDARGDYEIEYQTS